MEAEKLVADAEVLEHRRHPADPRVEDFEAEAAGAPAIQALLEQLREGLGERHVQPLYQRIADDEDAVSPGRLVERILAVVQPLRTDGDGAVELTLRRNIPRRDPRQ